MTIPEILRSVKTLAVVGLSETPGKAAQYVPAYLAEQGYRILGVNPRRPGAARLTDLSEPVDLVLLFRPSEDIPNYLSDILALSPLPRVVWMQSGISHAGVAQELESRGIQVVQDRCMLVEHQALTGGWR